MTNKQPLNKPRGRIETGQGFYFALNVFPSGQWIDEQATFISVYGYNKMSVTMFRQQVTIPGRDSKPALGIQIDVVYSSKQGPVLHSMNTNATKLHFYPLFFTIAQ